MQFWIGGPAQRPDGEAGAPRPTPEDRRSLVARWAHLEVHLAVDVARKTFARRAAAFVKRRSRPIISVIAIVVVSSKVTSKTLVMRALYLAREASRARED